METKKYELIKSNTIVDHLLIYINTDNTLEQSISKSHLKMVFPLPLYIMIFPLYILCWPWNLFIITCNVINPHCAKHCGNPMYDSVFIKFGCDSADCPWYPITLMIGNIVYLIIGCVIVISTESYDILSIIIYTLVLIYCMITWIWTLKIEYQMRKSIAININNWPKKDKAIRVDFKSNENYLETYKISVSLNGLLKIEPNFRVLTVTKTLLNSKITYENFRTELDDYMGEKIHNLYLGETLITWTWTEYTEIHKNYILSEYNHAQNVLLPEYINHHNDVLVSGYIKSIDRQFNEWFVPYQVTELILDFYCFEYRQGTIVDDCNEAQLITK